LVLHLLPGRHQGCPALHPVTCYHTPELVCLQQQLLLLLLL
jgi:hypothetical protein